MINKNEMYEIFKNSIENLIENLIEVEIEEENIKKYFNIIIKNYSEEHRYYHTLNHISSMLLLWKEYSKEFNNKDIICLTIFFHDIIYNCLHEKDENDSIILFKEFAESISMDKRDIALISKYIECTKEHFNIDLHPDQDVKYFLDLDLSILGSDHNTYILYARNVRKEYKHINIDQFINGRLIILNKFLNLKLFHTKLFQDLFQLNAIKNLKYEISILKNGELL